jgi:cytochrome c oxidase assembly protein subunit 15
MILHLYAVFVAISTAVLILAGGLVTSTGSGLSVPDWPNTYGWFMFSFPLDKMVGGIRYEHTHRLIASTVGFLILVLAFCLRRAEPRAWVRQLGYVALGAVVTQGSSAASRCSGSSRTRSRSHTPASHNWSSA